MQTLRVDIERVTINVRTEEGERPYKLELWDTVGEWTSPHVHTDTHSVNIHTFTCINGYTYS